LNKFFSCSEYLPFKGVLYAEVGEKYSHKKFLNLIYQPTSENIAKRKYFAPGERLRMLNEVIS